jgi:phosphate/sulfate permease
VSARVGLKGLATTALVVIVALGVFLALFFAWVIAPLFAIVGFFVYDFITSRSRRASTRRARLASEARARSADRERERAVPAEELR